MKTREEERIKSELFYNNFSDKLVKDYLFRNARMEEAISFAIDWISDSDKNILDIGCGIGWSSFEVAKTFNKARVLGIDLSQELIHTANQLFNGLPNLSFQKVDITTPNENLKHKFNTIILLDVYEHISKKDRERFHLLINSLLEYSGGRIILSCPSVLHQNWLKQNNPAGLQPIDENITLETLQQFARIIKGDVIYYQQKNIWNNNDYFHAIIEKGVSYSKTSMTNKSSHKRRSELHYQRFKRVRKKNKNIVPNYFNFKLKRFLNKLRNIAKK